MRPEVYIISSIIGWGVGSFIYKFANDSMHHIMVSTVSLGLYIILTPLLWLFIKFDHTISISGILYTSIASLFMCLGTFGFSYALRNGSDVGETTILTALYPALTLILSMIFLGESLTIKKGIGILLALVSFLLIGIK